MKRITNNLIFLLVLLQILLVGICYKKYNSVGCIDKSLLKNCTISIHNSNMSNGEFKKIDFDDYEKIISLCNSLKEYRDLSFAFEIPIMGGLDWYPGDNVLQFEGTDKIIDICFIMPKEQLGISSTNRDNPYVEIIPHEPGGMFYASMNAYDYAELFEIVSMYR